MTYLLFDAGLVVPEGSKHRYFSASNQKTPDIVKVAQGVSGSVQDKGPLRRYLP